VQPTYSWQQARSNENLQAACALRAKHPNASASRYYYAIYHVSWFILARAGKSPTDYVERLEEYESWPHKWLKLNARTVVQHIPGPAAVQKFSRQVDELLKKFYTYRINADYLAAGVKPQALAVDAVALERLIPDLFSACS
jgi:hypothetical protein